MATYAVILPAAGRSSRFHSKHYKKPFAPLGGRAVWLYSAERFLAHPDVKQVILVISSEDREDFDLKFAQTSRSLASRSWKGAKSERIPYKMRARVNASVDFVAIHDAARPGIADEWISQVFREAERTGAAMLALPIAGTLKRVGNDDLIQETVPRSGVWEAQTPQVFRRDWLLDAYARCGDFVATDDAQVVERAGYPVKVLRGSPINFKITTQEDLRLAEHAIKALPKPKAGPLHPFADDDLWR